MLASEISTLIDKPLVGPDIEVNTYSTIDNVKPLSVVFVNRFDIKYLSALNTPSILAIVCPEYADLISCSHIVTEQARLDYLRVIKAYFCETLPQEIHSTAIIEPGAIIGKNVHIGSHCYIGPKVSIGNNTRIEANVVIDGQTYIGCDCYFKSGSVIGQSGFGFERNADGIPEHFPHLGIIRIGNNVQIGANNTIDRATLGETVIEDHSKTDNLVHIAHNDFIERATLITAGVIFSGGVRVGSHSWIAPNTSLKEKITIGRNSFVGLGAVVINDVEADTVVVGNPAKPLKK